MTLHLILGDCLFSQHENLFSRQKANAIIMIEDEGLCTHYQYHKHKLILFLSAMRQHAEALALENDVHYYALEAANGEIDSRSFEEKLDHCIQSQENVDSLRCYKVDDQFFEERLLRWSLDRGLEITWVDSPKFLFPLSDFDHYLKSHKKPFLKTYYERQRKALGILVDEEGKPSGGKWSYDAENRKKLPKNYSTPAALHFSENPNAKEVKALVNRHFSHHPGDTNTFRWASNRKEALAVLDQFISEKLNLFGPYEDAFEAELKFGYHSTLSPYLNMGLLSPEEVISEVLEAYQKNGSALASVEGFIRQVLGWREFIRGMYRNFDFGGNHFNLQNKLSPHWYEGTTGITPLDDSIKKVKEEAYNHHIERLMVIGNLMLLCEIDPQEVYRWFMEMYIDSADWVMAPNVLGMSQFADGGLFATKPYIAGSNYMRKMSHYPKGDWCDIVDGLYWRFIDKHRATFASNPRMSMMLGTLNKMNTERRVSIFGAAEQFLERIRV